MVEIFPQIKYDIVVVGGGPAGIAAALFAAKDGMRVAIVEKNRSLGRKLCITGKGRCNITNACDKDDFFANIPENPRFMYSPYSFFSNQDLIAFIEDLGVKTVVERGGRVFPASGDAKEVRDALRDALKTAGVKVYYDVSVTGIITEDGKAIGVVLSENNIKLYAPAVVIATGGLSYKATGSTGDGYGFAKDIGHTIIPQVPALVGIDTKETFPSELAGLTLKNSGIKFTDSRTGKLIYEDFGEILFTHTGLSGPTVLSASFFLNDREEGSVKISIDLKTALDADTLDKRILRDFSEFSKRKFANSLSKLLPSSLIPVFIRKTGISEEKAVSEITKAERARIVSTLKSFELTFKCLRNIDEAIITRGGVNVSEIDPKTMASKKCDGIYIAGEVLAVTGYTGGFNLTIAFSTGALAGRSAAVHVKNINQ